MRSRWPVMLHKLLVEAGAAGCGRAVPELMPVLMMPSALTMACLIENYFCRLAMRNTSTGN